jgi:hypothetical protein
MDTPNPALAITVSGSHAYVTDIASGPDETSGLEVIDITNPSSPAIVGRVDTPGHPSGVTVSGGYAYVADDAFLQVIDITNPANPTIVGSVGTPGHASGVDVSGGYAYVADGSYYQLEIVPAQCEIPNAVSDGGAGPPSLGLRAFPNPFHSSTLIRLEAGRDRPAGADIYDVSGRKVRSLFDGSQNADIFGLQWDGRNDAGRVLPSGVYFVRVTTAQMTGTLKIVIVR